MVGRGWGTLKPLAWKLEGKNWRAYDDRHTNLHTTVTQYRRLNTPQAPDLPTRQAKLLSGFSLSSIFCTFLREGSCWRHESRSNADSPIREGGLVICFIAIQYHPHVLSHPCRQGSPTLTRSALASTIRISIKSGLTLVLDDGETLSWLYLRLDSIGYSSD